MGNPTAEERIIPDDLRNVFSDKYVSELRERATAEINAAVEAERERCAALVMKRLLSCKWILSCEWTAEELVALIEKDLSSRQAPEDSE